MPGSVSTVADPSSGQFDKSEKSSDKNWIKVDYLETPVKSTNDKKDYRVIRLPNGLTALLISDVLSTSSNQIYNDDIEDDNEYTDNDESRSGIHEKEKEKNKDTAVAGDLSNKGVESPENKRPQNEERMAACCLCIGVGSFSDPSEIPGMAHFLEHMLFMGSEKYPQENDFDSFIKKRGGYTNTDTNCEHTLFCFEIHKKHLFATLDRWAQFFISPLLKRDAITREREAIDSEFQLSVQCDDPRRRQLFSSFAQPGHPARKFKCKNLITLRDNITDDKLYEELHNFRQRHYNAHRMTLTLQAPLPIDKLEQYVKDCFSTVPNNGLPPDDFTQFKGIQTFDTPNFKRIYKIKPVSDICEIQVSWIMPSLHHLYKCKPLDYVSWIIGHKGKGSLISYLRKKLWCLDSYCGSQFNGFSHNSMYALFTLTLVLTEDGNKHLKDVLDVVFSYISLVRRSGPQKRIYDEIHQVRETSFRFTDEIPAVNYVQDLSENMHFYPPKDYITGSELFFEYNPTEIKACMDALTPDNVNIIIFDKKFNDAKFDKVEPWYKTKYTDMAIPNEWIEHWGKIEPLIEFHLPEPNIFITDDFSLVSLPEEVPMYPTKIHSDALSEVWFRPDPTFKIPESYMNYYFMSPLALTSPENAVCMDLLVNITMRLLDEELYAANAAGLHYYIGTNAKGIIVIVSGFNQKLPIVLSTVTKDLVDCSNLVTQNLFDIVKAKQLKDYYNSFICPDGLSNDVVMSILELAHWTSNDKHAALSSVEFGQFQKFAKQFFDHIYLQCLVQGNMKKEDVIHNSQSCLKILKCGSLLPNTLPQLRVTQIPIGARCCRLKNFNKSDSTSVVTNYYQSGIETIKLSVIIQLLNMLMDEPVFNQLRTQEQLGYAVFNYMENNYGILGYCITVRTQANKCTTEYIDEEIEKFLKSFLEILEKISEKELSSFKDALVKKNQCAILNFSEEISRNWHEISTGEYMFDRADREIIAIKETNISELREWMKKHVLGGTNPRKLSIQIVGKPQEKDEIENESSEKNKVLNDSEGSTGTSKTCDNGMADSSKTSVEHISAVKFPLEYMTDMPNEKKVKPPKYYITDIEDYKKSLQVLPANLTAIDDDEQF